MTTTVLDVHKSPGLGTQKMLLVNTSPPIDFQAGTGPGRGFKDFPLDMATYLAPKSHLDPQVIVQI